MLVFLYDPLPSRMDQHEIAIAEPEGKRENEISQTVISTFHPTTESLQRSTFSRPNPSAAIFISSEGNAFHAADAQSSPDCQITSAVTRRRCCNAANDVSRSQPNGIEGSLSKASNSGARSSGGSHCRNCNMTGEPKTFVPFSFPLGSGSLADVTSHHSPWAILPGRGQSRIRVG